MLTPYSLAKHMTVQVYIVQADRTTSALLDCRSMGNFIHEDLVHELGLTQKPCNPLPLHYVKGLNIGTIQYQVTIKARVGNHNKTLTLDVAPIRRL